MIGEDERAFHTRRARDEFDLAYMSADRSVAAVHLRLSSLHMEALRTLNAARAEPEAAGGQSIMAAI